MNPGQPTAKAPLSSALRGLLLGAAVSAGWILHDFGVFADSGEPPLVLDILPGSALVVLAGALVGLCCSIGRWTLALALVAAGLAAALVRHVFPSAAQVEVWLPRAIFIALLGFAIASWLGPRLRTGAPRLGPLAGALGAFAIAHHRDSRVSWPVLLAALGVALAGMLPRSSLRRAGTALACVLGAAWLGWRIRPDLSPSRPDLGPPPRAAASEAPDLVLVVLDTLRADHLAPYGYERVTTPGLDALVSEHFTRYANARSASNWTLPSHASLLTGLRPAEHGTVYSGFFAQPLRPEVPTLAEILRDAGYQTAAIVANEVYLTPSHGIDRGFDHFDDRHGGVVGNYLAFAQLCGLHLAAGHLAYRTGETITDTALRWLDGRREGPFFLFLNYMDVHTPNVPPPPFDEAFNAEEPRDPLQPDPADTEMASLLYDRELAYMDRELTRLLDELAERDLFDSTVIAVTSDHGEGLGEHGTARHGRVIYEALVRVPLYVKPAGERAQAVVDQPVTSSDVFHIALRLLGIASEPTRQDGPWSEWYMNPRPPERAHIPPKLPSLLCWTDGPIKTIVSGTGKVEVFDLSRDPRELAPLPLTPQEIEAALARARAWWDEHPIEAKAATTLGDDEVERMRALGYLGDEDG